MNLMIVILLLAGVVILYSAVKGKDPRSVVKQAIRGQ